ncbi:aldo/keto reductase [Nocardia sp. BMG111209]|uniref:aldo/keto reductase n=1 Tax=Nocardia sp. BMG111209 TaxID=1160137 RepID=UPI0003618F9C|nr:aldo/keto reductase [Nocardia sp. BMG111209]
MITTELTTTSLGSTGMRITRVGFGGWAIGGGRGSGGGPQDDARSIATIEYALECGINWIDTAAAYGGGRSESLIGKTLRGRGCRPYLFTKCSLPDNGTGRVRHRLTRDRVLRDAEASLDRLGAGALDLYQIHWPKPDSEIEAGWAALAELKDQGLVRHIGVSNFDGAQLDRISAIAPVETLRPAYSLVDRAAATTVLPHAERAGIGVIACTPLASGLLTGAMTRQRIARLPAADRRSWFREPALSGHLDTAARTRRVADRHRVAPGAVAVAWVLADPAIDAATIGFRHPAQIAAILPAADLELTTDDLAELAATARTAAGGRR